MSPSLKPSREDLSAALVGQPTDGIIGYQPASAVEILTHMLRFALDAGAVAK